MSKIKSLFDRVDLPCILWTKISKTNISKFLFHLDNCQTLSHDSLVWEIAQALLVLLALNKLLYFTERIYFTYLGRVNAHGIQLRSVNGAKQRKEKLGGEVHTRQLFNFINS